MKACGEADRVETLSRVESPWGRDSGSATPTPPPDVRKSGEDGLMVEGKRLSLSSLPIEGG